ncbi:MAG: glycosyltransferase family 4 protein, partial [Thermoprotei archaeon]
MEAPPEGVKYVVKEQSAITHSRLDSYQLSPLNFIYWLGGALADHLNPPSKRQLIHSFFWNYFSLWSPWIHENDSSLSQYLNGYFGVAGGLLERTLKLSSALLNASSCRKVVVWSNHARQGMINDGVREEKVVVIPPPMTQKEVSRSESDAVTITFVGRDFERKGGRLVIEAFRKLSSTHNVRLNYVGRVEDDGLKEYLRSDSRVNYRDFMVNSLLHSDVFPKTDLLVLPTKAEAFGLTVLEAMSYGIPVVASDLPVICELLDGYKNECTFDRARPSEFFEKLVYFVE